MLVLSSKLEAESSMSKLESSKSLAVRNRVQRTQDFGSFSAILQWTKSVGGGSITGGFKPQFQGFLCVAHRFVLRIARRGTTWQLGKHCRPALGFEVEFDKQSQLHSLSFIILSAMPQIASRAQSNRSRAAGALIMSTRRHLRTRARFGVRSAVNGRSHTGSIWA